MLAASGTETSLSGNYRSSTAAYYAALSGLEEGRARLLPQYPGGKSLSPAFIPAYGATLPLGTAIYIKNAIGGETVDPTALGNPDEYPDTEWAVEFPNYNPPLSVQTALTDINLAGAPNALYKWVRINALTEQAIQIDVNDTNPGAHIYNNNRIIYFDGTNLTRTVAPYQALGVTALAALPDGSRKLLQYVVAPVSLNLQLFSAISMQSSGSSPSLANFDPPVSHGGPLPFSFFVKGQDQQGLGKYTGPGCSPQPFPVPAIGVFNSSDVTNVKAGTSAFPSNFSGTAPSNNVVNLMFSPPSGIAVWNDPVQLSNLVANVASNADASVNGPATAADMPPAMNAGNPMTVVVNGDLSLSGFTGYGVLVVTGTLTYTGDSGWRGIVLVVGQGIIVETGSASGGEFDGAVVVANISGGAFGTTSWSVDSPGGSGVFYDSCWIAAVQKPTKYKILSFREIPYP